jgi:HSP20 family protein
MMMNGWREFDQTFRALDSLQRRIDGAMGGWGGLVAVPARRAPRTAWPLVNAFETKEAFVYKAFVPGLGEGDVSVYVEEEVLVLRGERRNDVPDGYQVNVRERTPVAFTRKLPLAGRVDAEGVVATMKDGVLTVTLPKAKDTLPRQIAVKAL